MTYCYTTKSMSICSVFLVSLVSITTGLNLEELSLGMQKLMRHNEELSIEIRQLKQNDVAKDARLQELELKVQHLEIKMMKQGEDFQKIHNVQSAMKENAYMLGKQNYQRVAVYRTCKELRQADPSLDSGMYWIDPDGHGVGDDSIYVQCDMATGKTSVLHDSEDPTDVGHCADPGCYSKLINYSASMRQMSALAELSIECHQSIRYDCNFAPLETTNGVALSWWNDRNGVEQYFWSGSNSSIHTCQCGIDNNCVEVYYLCNCDSSAPIPLSDNGVITDKSYLPITRLNFGRTQLETSSGVHTLGRFECSGQISVTGMPTSCSDLWKIGNTLSGIYSVMGSDYVETVYCNFERLPHEQGFQTLIGYADVKSSLVYFYVQRDWPYALKGTAIPFEITRLNIGGAMNPSSGIFTAPRNGIYSFHFSCLTYHPTSSGVVYVYIDLILNGVIIGSSTTSSNDDSSYYTQSLHSTLELKMGDQVWISIAEIHDGAYLQDNNNEHYTHFTGYFLQENLASSLQQ